jgi:hypothetical protein
MLIIDHHVCKYLIKKGLTIPDAVNLKRDNTMDKQ